MEWLIGKFRRCFAEKMQAACKSYSHSQFFSKKFQHICLSLDVNFNESLTDDVVSFEQLGPAFKRKYGYIYNIALILLIPWYHQEHILVDFGTLCRHKF